MRSAELTLPGFIHDVCAAVVPLALASPFFRTLPLAQHGLAFIQPDAPLAHPLDDGTAVIVERSVEQTAAGLGLDGSSYARLFGPLARDWGKLEPVLLGALKFPSTHDRRAIGLMPYVARHSRNRNFAACARPFRRPCSSLVLPLEDSPSAAFGLILGVLARRGLANRSWRYAEAC